MIKEQGMTTTQWIVTFLMGLILFGMFGYINVSGYYLRKDLDNRGVETYGLVYSSTENSPQTRGAIYYSYRVNGKSYKGILRDSYSSYYKMGEHIRVRYDSLNPSHHRAFKNKKNDPPEQQTITSITFKLLGIMGISLFLIFGLRIYSIKRKK